MLQLKDQSDHSHIQHRGLYLQHLPLDENFQLVAAIQSRDHFSKKHRYHF